METQKSRGSRRDKPSSSLDSAPRLSEKSQAFGSATIAPVAVKPRSAALMLSTGLTRIYELINAGELVSFRNGRARLITVESINAYVARKVAAASSARKHSSASGAV